MKARDVEDGPITAQNLPVFLLANRTVGSLAGFRTIGASGSPACANFTFRARLASFRFSIV